MVAPSLPRIEARPYGPDASDAERRALKARVRWLDDDIIEYVEVPVMSTFSIELMMEAIQELVGDRSRFALLIDLTGTTRPSAEIRECLRKCIVRERHRVRHVAMFTDGFLLSVAATFVFGHLGVQKVTTHTTRAGAIEALRHARR